ncbi:hypothetical protein [Ruthenibacterium lactatiformans]|uniref:hypothetical protein n=1 Tax=Ruthenibacterium lactatiformans TaxID=1550024 RepID=UPI0029424437|nr:hypothetical protein [Ruthenibacterium lactatiformans]
MELRRVENMPIDRVPVETLLRRKRECCAKCSQKGGRQFSLRWVATASLTHHQYSGD